MQHRFIVFVVIRDLSSIAQLQVKILE